MHLLISNIKLSAKIPEKPLNEIKDRCRENQIQFSTYNNFIVFRSSSFTFTVFKKKLLKNCDKNTVIKQHVNITVNSLEKIPEAIESLKKILGYNKNINVHFQIDNLTATASLDKKINVDLFLENTKDIADQVSFNPEKFPAIFIKHKNRKILLFRSGVLNILGSKSTKELDETYSWICTKCASIYSN